MPVGWPRTDFERDQELGNERRRRGQASLEENRESAASQGLRGELQEDGEAQRFLPGVLIYVVENKALPRGERWLRTEKRPSKLARQRSSATYSLSIFLLIRVLTTLLCVYK